MDFLTSDQRVQLDTFRKIIADAREPDAAAQLLAMCNGDVQQALQLHWATVGDAAENSGTPAASRSKDGTLAEEMNDDVAGCTRLRNMEYARAGAAQAQIMLFCGRRPGLQRPPLRGSVAMAVPVKA